MNISEVNLHDHWDNLIFTNDNPGDGDAKQWALRGHKKTEKTKGWFQMTILSSNCDNRQQAIDKAKEFTIQFVFTQKMIGDN